MKIYKLFLFVLILPSCKIHHQLDKQLPVYKSLTKYKGDTVQYARDNFIARKKEYVGQPLNKFLKDFELPIKSYSPVIDNNMVDYVYLSPFKNILQRLVLDRKNPLIITVQLTTKIPVMTIINMTNEDKYQWAKKEKDYFGKIIVKDLDLKDYLEGGDSAFP